ncbi:multidrug effflux MFS transporter [Panacibacter sp. DH6]|uniref:Multidrug effflux MFS transporter n=1 Tax=Panacibacter microcysteis TaxID=2793269 RepID=A0A931E5W3_9BACT|nr:multidrug effflux MFS transporter [Panacibacter microcysteis]MBG9377628.1 multidrug effflux MFS transporter [Panacibacter microcysteis]
MKTNKRFLLVGVLGLLSSIGPFSIDMYLPGFPQIASDLHTTVAVVSLSLSSFFIGISIGQLIYGPLLDRFGRKRPLCVGLILYIITSAGCALAASADQLIILRFLQAFGSCAGMVASRAMVRDLFPVNETAKVFSQLMLVIGVSPIIAPTAGGYLTAAFGWHSVFVVLTIMVSLILAAVYFFLPESKKPDRSISLRVKPTVRNYISVIKEPQFLTYSFTGALATAGLYAYISGSPHVFMQLFNASEKLYGWIFAIIAAGLIACSQVNSFLLRKYRSEQIIRVASICQAITGATLFVFAIVGWLNLLGSVIIIAVFLCCQGFIFPNASALSLAPFTRNAGSASAMLGAIQMSIGAISSATVSALSNNTALPMTGIMACCTISSLLVLTVGKTIIRYKVNSEGIEEETAEMISTL